MEDHDICHDIFGDTLNIQSHLLGHYLHLPGTFGICFYSQSFHGRFQLQVVMVSLSFSAQNCLGHPHFCHFIWLLAFWFHFFVSPIVDFGILHKFLYFYHFDQGYLGIGCRGAAMLQY
jgi:hypothetical protein